ncbi:MAG: hypothetical protein PF692_14315 [Kiritimatiellae bacterium]|jgi:hypothetical protein|nr:hypothetical protein [Kiritimatiellia bacterium]
MNEPKQKINKDIMISGLGHYQLTKKRKQILMYSFLTALAITIVGLAVFGGYVIMTANREEPAVFVAPPPTKKYEPRILEHKVKVQKKQRSSSRPSVIPRMTAMKKTSINLPEIKADPKTLHTTFQPKFKAVSGKGMGAGLGTGYGTHGFGSGVSQINFFGLKAKGEKIAILVDASVSMVEEERGGVPGYLRVKQRIEDVIDALSPGSLFTVIAFADAAEAMTPKMIIANEKNKNDAKMFIRPYNTDGNWGLTTGNIESKNYGDLRAVGGTTRLDLALTGAFDQGADTIMIISDGIPRVEKALTPEQMQSYQKKREQWFDTNQGAISNWENARASAPAGTAQKVWIPPVAASTGPPKEGQQPRQARAGYWKTVTVGGFRRARPNPPPPPKAGFWTLADFVKYMGLMYDEEYKPKGVDEPVIFCIGYQIDQDGGSFLKNLASHYHGQYRSVRKIK